MPRCSDDTILFFCPFDCTFRCAVFPAIQRVVVHKVKAADRRQLSGIVLNVVEFLFGIAVIPAAVNFLLTGNDVRTIYALEVGHQSLGFLSCLGVYRCCRCLFIFRLRCLCQSHVVVQAIAPAAAECNGVFALGQLQIAPVIIVPVICMCDLDGLGSGTVVRTCDSHLCLPNVAGRSSQIHNASGHQPIHASFRCINGKAHGAGTGDPDKSGTGITRIFIIIDFCCNLCIT